MRLHPSVGRLGRYVDGDLEPEARTRVAAHLVGCPTCRERVQEWRAIGQRIREEAVPDLPPDLFDRIEARRAAGERVILPLSGPRQSLRAHRLAPVAAAAMLLLALAAALVLRTPDLSADASELLLSPAKPQAGDRVEVEYRGGSRFSGEERLVLRGLYFTPKDQAYGRSTRPVRITELTRDPDGIYHGSFRLPDSVVYALLAVEDSGATVVDGNGRKGWDLLVHGVDGKPLFSALEQNTNALMGRNWEMAYAVSRRAAELYPDLPQAWNLLRFFQQAVLGEAAMDSLRTFHQAQLAKLDSTLSGRSEISGDEAGWMYWYALGVGDTIRRAYWRERLLREHPEHPLAVQERVLSVRRSHPNDPAGALREMDRLWEEVGAAHEQQALLGFDAAQEVGDSVAVLRWAARYLYFRPKYQGWVAEHLTHVPAVRVEGLQRLREEILRLREVPDEDRNLFSTRQDQHRQNRNEMRWAYMALGDALLTVGDTTAGLDTLALAVSDGWNPSYFRHVADVRLAVGDTSGALELWARVAVDLHTSRLFADTVRARVGEHLEAARWQRLEVAAWERMRRATLASATAKVIRGPVRLLDVQGQAHALSDLTTGHTTVVVFWSRNCTPALEALPEAQQLAQRLERQGVRMVAIVDEVPSADLRSFLREKGLTLPVYLDTHGDGSRAFNQWGTPSYFLLDDAGRIRFEYTSLDAIERQVAVLEGTGGTESGQ
jgi:anti-sigma factor RsiW